MGLHTIALLIAALLSVNVAKAQVISSMGEAALRIDEAKRAAKVKRETDRLSESARITPLAFPALPSGIKPVEVFVVTNRRPTVGGNIREDERFGLDRSEESKLYFGRAEVTFPPDHAMGVIERPGLLAGMILGESAEKHVIVKRFSSLDRAPFFTNLETKANSAASSSTLIFIHGFAVSYGDAVRQAAQIALDLNFRGAPLLYTWPSQGVVTPFAYQIDKDNASHAAKILTDFLVDFFTQTKSENVHLLAHSMGTVVLCDALNAAFQRAPGIREKIGEVVLAAPDYDFDSFKNLVGPRLTQMRVPITLYASSYDRALLASESMSTFARAGKIGESPIFVQGIETIDVSPLESWFSLGHSYFSEMRTLLTDLSSVVLDQRRPPRNSTLAPITGTDGSSYWSFKK
jgi:esterase/lipase superfamily enzyme